MSAGYAAIPLHLRMRRAVLSRPAAGAFVWGLWALLFAAALLFVHRFVTNVPLWDEWLFVPYLTGQKPITWSWLWEQHNEHRIPLPKLIALLLSKVTGNAYRSGAFFTVIALGTTAACMMVVARRLRGYVSFADGFFPLALLHWGHNICLLWGIELYFALTILIPALFLFVVITRRDGLSLRRAILAWGCIVCLAMTGPCGLAFVPPLATWLGYVGIQNMVFQVAECTPKWLGNDRPSGAGIPDGRALFHRLSHACRSTPKPKNSSHNSQVHLDNFEFVFRSLGKVELAAFWNVGSRSVPVLCGMGDKDLVEATFRSVPCGNPISLPGRHCRHSIRNWLGVRACSLV